VIDAASVDARRRLILIRRDNVEHLLMIGGPTDIVVEPNIVRAVAASREAPGVRASAAADRSAVAPAETMMWPLQPDPIPARATRAAEETWQSEPAPRQRSAEPPAAPAAEPARPIPPAEVRASAERKPVVEAVRTPEAEPARPAAPAAAAAAEAPAAAAADQNLAEMAQRLEAALRRPTASAVRPAGAVDPEAKAETVVSLASRHSEAAPQAEKPARGEAKRAEPKPTKGLYDSLEQEMASLLGRPAARQ
jgi:flagellar protein FliO/FliZ